MPKPHYVLALFSIHTVKYHQIVLNLEHCKLKGVEINAAKEEVRFSHMAMTAHLHAIILDLREKVKTELHCRPRSVPKISTCP